MRTSRLHTKLLLAYVLANAPVVLLAVLVIKFWRGENQAWTALVVAISAAPIAAGLTYLLMRIALRQLGQLARQASAGALDADQPSLPVESSDEVGQIAAAINDIREADEVQVDQLKEDNRRLATVLTSMGEGVVAVNVDERILLANQASRRLLNFSTPEVVGRPLLEVARSRPLHEAIQSALRCNQSHHCEFEPPGEPRRVLSLHASCLPGQPCPGVVVVLHDVSELRRLENLRREFVANVSHELKTPLAAIKAYAETLRLGAINDSENNLGFVQRIEEQADRLHQLILDMLQIARVESGRESLEIGDIPVAGVVNACSAQFMREASGKSISLRIQPPDQPLLVRADQDGLRTILENLVDNAIKYTPESGQVAVSWWSENSSVVLEVRDSGIGIDATDQSRVFERFFRVDQARSRELGGTGLGLSIVKHLAQAFGGSVSLTSELGQGSRFLVRLPVP